MDPPDIPHETHTITMHVTTEHRYGLFQCRVFVADYLPRGATIPGLGVIGNADSQERAMREVLSHLASLIAADMRGEVIACDTPDPLPLSTDATDRICEAAAADLNDTMLERLQAAKDRVRELESLLLTVECKRCHGRGEVTVETAVPDGDEPIGSHGKPCTACHRSGRRFRGTIIDDGTRPRPLIAEWPRSDVQLVDEIFAVQPPTDAIAECKRALDKANWLVSDMAARNGQLVKFAKDALAKHSWSDTRQAFVILGYAKHCGECGGRGIQTFGRDHGHDGQDMRCETCGGSGLVAADATVALRAPPPSAILRQWADETHRENERMAALADDSAPDPYPSRAGRLRERIAERYRPLTEAERDALEALAAKADTEEGLGSPIATMIRKYEGTIRDLERRLRATRKSGPK